MPSVKPFKMYNCKSFKTAVLSNILVVEIGTFFVSSLSESHLNSLQNSHGQDIVLGSQKIYYTVHTALACQTHIILYMYMMKYLQYCNVHVLS